MTNIGFQAVNPLPSPKFAGRVVLQSAVPGDISVLPFMKLGAKEEWMTGGKVMSFWSPSGQRVEVDLRNADKIDPDYQFPGMPTQVGEVFQNIREGFKERPQSLMAYVGTVLDLMKETNPALAAFEARLRDTHVPAGGFVVLDAPGRDHDGKIKQIARRLMTAGLCQPVEDEASLPFPGSSLNIEA